MSREMERRMWSAWSAVCAVALLLCSGAALVAQAGRGAISGLVTDQSGAVIPGAKLVLKSPSTGITSATVSTGSGLYSFLSLVPGNYEITVSAVGFDTLQQQNIRISVDQTATLNLALKIGGANEIVTVTDAPTLTESSNSTVGQLISAETIDRVPLVSRDVYELIQLSAGVVPANGTANAADTPGIFNARSGADVAVYTINGALQGTAYYMLDGSPIGVAENNAATIIPAMQIPEDAVAEYRVETQNTPATYASGGAGVISLVSKSGTNQFHGTAFGYFRPSALAANEYFTKQAQLDAGEANTAPDFHRYQEGGSISGPILKDKLFFFGDYEATQQQRLEAGSYTVPTEDERGGDFSADSFTIYNPLLPDVIGDDNQATRQPFDGNVIPQGDLNPIAQKFAAMFPKPNRTGVGPYHTSNYFASGLDPDTEHKFDVRLDYILNQQQRLFGRFSFARLKFGNANLYGSDNMYNPSYYQNITNSRNIVIGDDVALSPTSMLLVRYSFARHFENQTGDPRQAGFDITTLGFPQSLASEVWYKQIPTISFGNNTATIGGTGNWDTFIFASENSDLGVTYTKSIGKHELSAGFEYQKKFMNIGQPPSPAGAYGFDDTATSSTTYANDGNDFASFLIGMGQAPGAESYNFTKDIFAAEANPYWAAFLQDNFHITPKLTVSLGLRWDIFMGRTERYNRQEIFDPNYAFSVDGLSLTGAERFAGSGHRNLFDTNLKDIGPRASFAWQPAQNLVLRGGAGIYYGPSTQMVANPSLNTDSYGTITSWNATQYNANGNSIFNSTDACPNDGDVQGCYSLSNPFPDGVIQPTNGALGASTNLGGTLNAVFASQRTPATYNFNFGVEYQFPHETVLSAAYVGSRGLFLPLGSADLNQLSLETIAKYGEALCVEPGLSGCVTVPNQWASTQPATNANYGSATVPQWVALQEFPQFGNGSYGSGNGVNISGYPGGDSEYSSLQAKVEKRLTHHFTTLATFTWGKIITDDFNPPLSFVGYHGAATQDWKNLNLEHSLSPQDVKYQFNWQASYDLPMGKGRALNVNGLANSVLGGWTVNTIVYLSTGVPINAPGGTGDIYFAQRVDMTCDPSKGAAHTPEQWFNWTCFSQPDDALRPGTAPAFLGNVRTPGARDLDMSFYKSFPLGRDRSLRLEASAYNVTNSVQFGYPNVFWNQGAASDPELMDGFGQITYTVNVPRQFQFAAKLSF